MNEPKKCRSWVLCQSCGMPMEKAEQFGTNKDGSKNDDYCVYCFKDGEFTANINLDEMIAHCAEHVDEWGIKMTKEEAIAHMREHFPKLKRWKLIKRLPAKAGRFDYG